MRLLFLIPTNFDDPAKIMSGRLPLGILYIASYVKARSPDIVIKVVDCTAEKSSLDEAVDRVKQFKPDVVGITIITHLVKYSLKAAESIKKQLPGCKIICGGTFVNALPKEMLNYQCIDYAISGEAEPSFHEFIRLMNGEVTPGEVPGLVYREEGMIKSNKAHSLLKNLDDLPFPARHLVDASLYFPQEQYKSTSILTSRGCSFPCIYCSHKLSFGQRIRRRSVSNILKEIELCVNDKIRSFEFVDSIFVSSKSHTEALCDGLIKANLNIRWGCQTRIDSFLPSHDYGPQDIERLLHKMKESGCWCIFFGIDSGSQNILDLNKKVQKLDDVNIVLDMVRSSGIETEVNFVLGLYGETRDTLKETFAFAGKIRADRVFYNRAWAFPGTEFYDKIKGENMLITEDYWLYPEKGISLIDYGEFDSRELEKLVKAHLIKEKTKPRYLLRKLVRLLRDPTFKNVSSNIQGIRRFILKAFYPEM